MRKYRFVIYIFMLSLLFIMPVCVKAENNSVKYPKKAWDTSKITRISQNKASALSSLNIPKKVVQKFITAADKAGSNFFVELFDARKTFAAAIIRGTIKKTKSTNTTDKCKTIKEDQNYDDEKPIDEATDKDTLIPQPVEEQGNILSIHDLLMIAFNTHPEIASKRAEIAQQQARLAQVYALYDPTVNFNLFNYNYSRTPPTSAIHGATSNISANYTLSDFGQKTEYARSVKEYIESARLNLLVTWSTTAKNIKDAYTDVKYYEWLEVIQLDDLQKAKRNLDIAWGFYNAGAKAKVDVTQAEIELSQSESDLAAIRTYLSDSKTRLAQASGVDTARINNSALENALLEHIEFPEIEIAKKEMQTSNPSVLAYMAVARGGLAMAKYYQALNRPTLLGNASYGGTGEISPINTDIWNVNVTLTFPLFNNNTICSKSGEQVAIADQYAKLAEATVITYAGQIERAYIDVDSALKRQTIAEQEVKSAFLNYSLQFKRYKMGVSQIYELNTARDYLNGARKTYLQTIYDRKNAETNFENAIGIAPPVS